MFPEFRARVFVLHDTASTPEIPPPVRGGGISVRSGPEESDFQLRRTKEARRRWSINQGREWNRERKRKWGENPQNCAREDAQQQQ